MSFEAPPTDLGERRWSPAMSPLPLLLPLLVFLPRPIPGWRMEALLLLLLLILRAVPALLQSSFPHCVMLIP